MSIAVVSNFTRKSAPKSMTKGLKPIEKTLKECLLELADYINGTIDEYLAGKSYNDVEIANWIFKESYQITSPAESETYVKINLFVAKKTLQNIITEIQKKKGGLSYHNIMSYRELLYDFLQDIKGFIDYYRQKKHPNFVFLTGGKNYMTSSFETFMMARGFFYSSLFKNNFIPYKEAQGMVAMTLRQSIEIKTKRIVGIDILKKKPGIGRDYSFKKIFDFIKNNKADIEYDPINFDILRKIYSWSCAYIHNGDISYLWQTDWSMNYLKGFFSPGTSTTGTKNVISVFGAFKLNNFNSLKSKLQLHVGADYEIVFLPTSKVEAIIKS